MIAQCALHLISLWEKAQCYPKSHIPVKKKLEKFWNDFTNRRKKKANFFTDQYPLGVLFDIVSDKRGSDFDQEFYEDQKTKRCKEMQDKVNPSFVHEQEQKEKTKVESEKRRASQYMAPEVDWDQEEDEELAILTDSPEKNDPEALETVPGEENALPSRQFMTRSRSALSSRSSFYRDMTASPVDSPANKCTCQLDCHLQKPDTVEVGVQTSDMDLRKVKDYEDETNWPLRPVRGLRDRDGKHTQVDEKIFLMLCHVASKSNISIPATLDSVEIVANFFNNPWHQSKGPKNPTLQQQLSTGRFGDINIDNFMLPTPKTVRYKEMLLALGTEREIGYALLKSDSATLHDDGTRKRQVSGCIHGNQLTIDGVSRYLPPRLLAKENQRTVVEHIDTLLERFSVLTGHDKAEVWKKITALMTDLASENHHLAERIADHIQSPDIPGMPWCNLHTCLAWDRDLSIFHENLESQIGKDKLKASLHQISNKSSVKNNLSAQAKDLLLKFFAMENSSKPWSRAEEFCVFEEEQGRRNDVMLMKEGRFGRQCLASLKSLDILESAVKYLKKDKQCQNEVSRLLRSLLPCPVVHFEWTIEVLAGFHLMEPFLGIMLDQQPRPTHSEVRVIFQNLYKQMNEPIPGICFSSIERHALPSLMDGFSRQYKQSWMESFRKHLEKYDTDKVESVMRTLMKQLAATLSRQRGVQYEFGPEYEEYTAKKAEGISELTHLKPLSEIFSEEQLESTPIDNKVGENYFGQLTDQLRRKGGSAFKAIGERLVLKSNSDIAFSEGAEKMLKDKELRSKKQEIDKIEAEWSKAQKDVMRCKLASAAPESDILAKEQAKNKVLSLCLENGRRLGFNAPVSSQEDVNMMYSKIQKLNEQDQLSIMRREIKFKKFFFSELPPDYPLFKQYNITAKLMLQNLLALHVVENNNQESISVEDIYEVTESLILPMAKPKQRTKAPKVCQEPSVADLEWPPEEEEFVITLDEEEWNLGSVQGYSQDTDEVQIQILATLKTRAQDDFGKTYWVYSEEISNNYKKDNLLDMRPSVSLAKNIKRKEPVFSLLNRKVIESITAPLYPSRNTIDASSHV